MFSSRHPGATLPDPRRGAWASTASATVLLLTLTVGLASQGSFSGAARPGLAIGVAVSLAFALVGGRPGRNLVAPATACALLGGWAVAAGALREDVLAGALTAAVACGVAAVLVAVASLPPGDRRLVADSLPLIGGLLAVTAWVALLGRTPDWALVTDGLWRASGALGYPNALAAVLVPLALLTVARSSTLVGRSRWAAIALVVLMLTTAAATLSRGGLLALVVGVGALAALGDRELRRALLGPLTGATVATAALLPSLVASSPADVPVAVGGLGAGAILAVLVDRAARTRNVPTWLAAATLLTGAALAGVASQQVRSAVWEVTATRIGAGSSFRLDAAAAALRELHGSPLVGVGPGNGQVTWRDDAGAAVTLRFLHDEYLQVLLELGLIGAALLVVVLLTLWRSVHRGRPEGTAPPLDRATWAGAAAATAAFAVHSGFDFLWHVPALPVLAAVLLALAAVPPPAPAPGAEGAPLEPAGAPP
ncbi:MAG: O-antigen ligase family protein [Actinomycetales bacterium]